MTLQWYPFSSESLPPVGVDLIICTMNPLSTVRCYREGDNLYDWGGSSICDLGSAECERDLAGWRWAVLGEREVAG